MPTTLPQRPTDMWIHERFTCYSETLLGLESLLKKEKKLIKGIGTNIQKRTLPIIGKYGVRNSQWRYALGNLE